jgi:hypothetical protein
MKVFVELSLSLHICLSEAGAGSGRRAARRVSGNFPDDLRLCYLAAHDLSANFLHHEVIARRLPQKHSTVIPARS